MSENDCAGFDAALQPVLIEAARTRNQAAGGVFLRRDTETFQP